MRIIFQTAYDPKATLSPAKHLPQIAFIKNNTRLQARELPNPTFLFLMPVATIAYPCPLATISLPPPLFPPLFSSVLRPPSPPLSLPPLQTAHAQPSTAILPRSPFPFSQSLSPTKKMLRCYIKVAGLRPRSHHRLNVVKECLASKNSLCERTLCRISTSSFTLFL
jgi:hypothetical protein